MMFTEGLDESAKKWIKQGSSDTEEEEEEEAPKVRSPLSERLLLPSEDHLFLNNSPSHHIFNPTTTNNININNINTNNNAFIMSPHVLPPLKFHSSLLGGPHHTLLSRTTLLLDDDHYDDDDDHDDHDALDDESVASAPEDDLDTNYYESTSSKFNHLDSFENPQLVVVEDDIYGVPNLNSRRHAPSSMITNKNLRVQLPHNFTTTFTTTPDCESVGVIRGGCDQNNSNSACCSMQPPSSQQVPIIPTVHHESMLNDTADLGTPSAPPMVEIGEEGTRYEVESKHGISISGGGEGREKDLAEWTTQSRESSESVDRRYNTIPAETESQIHHPHTNSIDHSTYYNTSGQSAWQTMISYDACIRLCLYAWARGCTEAPEFLRDECLVLRSAFGLHNFLLQPQRVKQTEGRTLNNTEQTCPMKAKKAVGKIKVEVKKLRIIPRRKLKSTYSQRGAIFMQAGAEYVRHVSSVVKSRINSLRVNSFLVTSEDSVSCLFQLKSATEDTKAEQGSAICLHAGTGEYHVFFPESQGDALIVEVQDSKGSIEGRTTIPVSSLNDNHSEKIRWWPIYHDEHECIGKVQLYIGNTITFDETNQMKSSPVVETLAYDLLLEAAMRAQQFHSRNLGLHDPWKWLLAEFADYYGVSDSYTKLRYLTHVMNVATPTKDCLELVYELLVPITKARSEKSLSRQEKSILLDCETQVESLLSNVFENYKSLDENSPMGLAELFGPIIESAAPALAPAVQVFTLLHDILAQDAQTMLRNYLQTAAIKRCRKHLVETEEFMSTNSESYLVDPITMATAYLKMKNICINIRNEIKADIKIHNQHILPSSIDLSNIAAAVYSTELCNRLRGFLAALPPSSPSPHVNELLIATADIERDLKSWNISPVQGGLDSKDLFHNYIMVWVQDIQLNLLDLCKAEKVPWSGVTTSHSTTPFAEEMYEKIKDTLVQYEVVINRWPQYSLMLEIAVANVERAIIKALEKQYNDILTPLKDSIPKRLNVHVQKLTRRQSTALYVVPNQLGTFLNTIKRILDVLHCRVEDILKSWASCLPVEGDKKSLFGEQMNGITVLLRTKYKNFLQAIVGKLISNMQANRNTRLSRILEETREEDGEAEVRERMQMLSLQLIDSISNLHEVFGSNIFIAICRGFWDRMGETVLKFLEGRKENRVWYKGSFYALGILDDTFASQMQRLQGNALQEKDVEPPRSVIEARSILCRDTTNATDPSTYFYF